MKSGNLKFLETSGPLQASNGTALPLTFIKSLGAVKVICQIVPIVSTAAPVPVYCDFNHWKFSLARFRTSLLYWRWMLQASPKRHYLSIDLYKDGAFVFKLASFFSRTLWTTTDLKTVFKFVPVVFIKRMGSGHAVTPILNLNMWWRGLGSFRPRFLFSRCPFC
jgi:hypothetical protein